MDFIDKKEDFADMIEKYINQEISKEELIVTSSELQLDEDFKGKELFQNIFSEFERFLDELSKKELKQRVMIIRGFVD